MKPKKRVTLLDVAKHAGVSRATASLIVRGSPDITEKTRNKVLKSMQELGYVYDRVAANMRSNKTSTVGLIITDIANPFYSELLRGVHNSLDEAGYSVFLGTTFDLDAKQQKLLSTMLEHRVGGLILCPVSDSSNETIERIKQLDIPLVLSVRELENVDADYVGIDYEVGAQMAVNHLIQKGHQRIAFLGGFSGSTAWKKRKQGYCNALTQAGIELDNSLIIESEVSRDGGKDAVRKALLHQDPPTAAICFNDFVAHGVILGLNDAGLNPGKDMAVVGFDNVPEAALYNPPLTTVSSYARLIGSQAASLLHQRILNPDREQQRIILHPELVVRSSS
ncbi:LacI family DNA-binding transcriptional regulator [Bacillus timonensis]|uniref:LacI family DNA-binding transcriptional regulator n=1 Tax=Bacillus timonensis TaxID=1033734 RepID=A0A4S3PLY4_9BACI|nr:LacI family DNA-binding transcriptional regulator [Bacillus timonensis]THE10527.1 LacI family DNA-binding transcriptional regulator [Bacillus timonensis]